MFSGHQILSHSEAPSTNCSILTLECTRTLFTAWIQHVLSLGVILVGCTLILESRSNPNINIKWSIEEREHVLLGLE